VKSTSPPPSSESVSRRMRNTPSRDTPAELALRRLLHAKGLRYRVDARPMKSLRRKADIVFGPAKVAVFVDGCFWHNCPEHGSAPKANAEWWADKLRTNVERDRDTDAQLSAEGWRVLRFWEHESPGAAADLIAQVVAERRTRPARRTLDGPATR
jgi:DNA mismatch endonuclease (patch repair protein)